jgi:hypothetical protein
MKTKCLYIFGGVSAVSFITVFQFSLQRMFTSLVKFNPWDLVGLFCSYWKWNCFLDFHIIYYWATAVLLSFVCCFLCPKFCWIDSSVLTGGVLGFLHMQSPLQIVRIDLLKVHLNALLFLFLAWLLWLGFLVLCWIRSESGHPCLISDLGKFSVFPCCVSSRLTTDDLYYAEVCYFYS